MTTTPAITPTRPASLETVLAVVRAQVAWLDAANRRDPLEVGLRILKLAEETGEAAQAWIDTTGANPRKGTTHTRAQVAAELADVALSALVAIASLDLDPAEVLADKARVVAARLPNRPAEMPAWVPVEALAEHLDAHHDTEQLPATREAIAEAHRERDQATLDRIHAGLHDGIEREATHDLDAHDDINTRVEELAAWNSPRPGVVA